MSKPKPVTPKRIKKLLYEVENYLALIGITEDEVGNRLFNRILKIQQDITEGGIHE